MAEKKKSVDQKIFKRAQDHAVVLEDQYSTRNEEFEEYEKMFLLDWDDKPVGEKLKITISPDARNAVVGAVRLMLGTDPHFNLPDNFQDKELFEKAAHDAWIFSGRVKQEPVHHATLLSGFLFSEIHIAVTSTAHMLEFAKANNRGIKRAERIAKQFPFLFETWHPKEGYPEFDSLGLRAYLRKVSVKPFEIMARFGDLAKAVIGDDPNEDEDYDLYMYYNEDDYAVWVNETPLIAELHGLSRIPIAAGVCEGSQIFDKPEQNRQPMLYTAAKTGFWKRQNLALTVLFDNLYNVGITPTVKHTTPQGNPNKELEVSTTDNLRTIELEFGEGYEVVENKGLLDAALQYSVQLAEQKIRESTIYPQALGEPLQGNPAFSTVALLSQAGRLPLIGVQRRASWAIATAMDIAFEMYRDVNVNCDAFGIKPSQVPQRMSFDCKLDVDLPQDKLQMANVARILTTGDEPLTDKAWARQNILGIGQSDKMEENIWSEKAGTQAFLNFLMQQQQQSQMQQQMMAQQAAGGMQPGMEPGMMPPGGMLPPEMLQQPGGMPPMSPDQSQPGMAPGQAEMIQGIPPEMAGLMPGAGGAAMPPMPPSEADNNIGK